MEGGSSVPMPVGETSHAVMAPRSASGAAEVAAPAPSPRHDRIAGASGVAVQRRSGSASVVGRWLVAAMISAVVAFVGLMSDKYDLPLVATLDKFAGDWRIALGSPRASEQRPDIAIVMIDENTLLDYESRSPVDRRLLAEVLRAIDAAEPRAIAFDFIFDRPSRHDEELIAALRQSRAPVVLGAIDRRVTNNPEESFARQAAFLEKAGKPVGHVMLERKAGRLASGSDSTVRMVAGPSPPAPSVAPGQKLAPAEFADAFVDVIAKAAGIKHRPESREIAWLREPPGDSLFATLPVPRHDPAAVKPALEGVVPESWKEILKGRIVLVGAAMIDRDEHLTPLSVRDGPVPGVTIHAQALAQRIDGNRDVRQWPWPATLFVVTFVALVCFFAATLRLFRGRGWLFRGIGLAIIGVASAIAYALWRIDIPSSALMTAWLGAGFCGLYSDRIFGKLGV